MPRSGRDDYALRPIRFEPNFLSHAEGSVYVTCGSTRVVCTASVDEKVPPFLRGGGGGWLTAEYAMLPRATMARTPRERAQLSGRTQEIQRLIGRSLRAVLDLPRLGERTIQVDCDVIQADGGTRTTAINGAFVAVALAVERLLKGKVIAASPLRDFVAATSVGLVNGLILLDLEYVEDSAAEVDLNVVATGDGRLVEIQGTAEKTPFTDEQLYEMLEIAKLGIAEIVELQRRTLEAGKLDLDRLMPHRPR
jgi:ribonuclease PH